MQGRPGAAAHVLISGLLSLWAPEAAALSGSTLCGSTLSRASASDVDPQEPPAAPCLVMASEINLRKHI